MRKFCKEFVGKKHIVGTTMDLEVVDLSGANKNNAAITNEIYEMLYNNSDEVNKINLMKDMKYCIRILMKEE